MRTCNARQTDQAAFREHHEELRLGVTVTGLYGLVTMGLMIVFLRGSP